MTKNQVYLTNCNAFNRKWKPWANGIRSSAGSFPPVNVGSTAEEVDVYFFAPGVDPSSLDISIQNLSLIHI